MEFNQFSVDLLHKNVHNIYFPADFDLDQINHFGAYTNTIQSILNAINIKINCISSIWL